MNLKHVLSLLLLFFGCIQQPEMTNQINGRGTTQTSTPQPINGNNAVENPLEYSSRRKIFLSPW